MIRIWVHILSFYMLGLAAYPCTDTIVSIEREVISFLYLDTDEGHHDDHQHTGGCGDDGCSPLCYCSCCTTSAEEPVNTIEFISSLNDFYSVIPDYRSPFYCSSYAETLWQPPECA